MLSRKKIKLLLKVNAFKVVKGIRQMKGNDLWSPWGNVSLINIHLNPKQTYLAFTLVQPED